MSLFKNQINSSHHYVMGFACGIILCKLWNWVFLPKQQITTINPRPSQSLQKYEITQFPNIFGSALYTPCKCGFPHQVCSECKDVKLQTQFPANVLLFSKSIEYEIPNGGITFSFDTPLTVDTIENIALQLDISVPIQYGTVMIHYKGEPSHLDDTKGEEAKNFIELLWCANTSEEAKNIFPMIELLSRIVQICECSKALGYNYKPVTGMIIHDIDVYLE